MRKIKLFENFDSKDEPIYNQISIVQAKSSFKSRGGKDEDITKTEAEQIKKFIKSIGGLLWDDVDNELSFMHTDPPREVRITKGADDWFYVMDDFGGPVGSWYECDGLEGLIKCLEYL